MQSQIINMMTHIKSKPQTRLWEKSLNMWNKGAKIPDLEMERLSFKKNKWRDWNPNSVKLGGPKVNLSLLMKENIKYYKLARILLLQL
jgi:hypothetical protein